MRYCKYCGKEIECDIAKCPHCEKKKKKNENSTNSEQSKEKSFGAEWK